MAQNGGGAATDASTEVRESIEAKATPPAAVDAGADSDADGEADPDIEMTDVAAAASGGSRTTTASRPPRDTRDLLQLVDTTANYLRNYEEDGQEIALGFNRIPNKRLLPDYFDVIKEPVAFSTIRGKVQKKQYTDFSQFVRDVALICHNAQVYNRPSAPIFQDAVRLQAVFREKLQELIKDGSIVAEEAVLPDLGEIPDFSPSPEPEGDEEDEEDEDDDDDDDEEDDDDDGAGRGRHNRQQGANRTPDHRPARLYTPMENRVLEILKGLRQMRDEDGDQLVEPFETLPDRAQLPEYYEEIKQPIALDIIKQRLRGRAYGSVDAALADLDLMCNNAQVFNEDGSAIFEAAVALQRRSRELAVQQMARPDDDFRDGEGRLALGVLAGPSGPPNGPPPDMWRVGDWVLLRNANDPGKPTVAQIFQMWIDAQGQPWLKTCWYYRPEQTVHRVDKHFYVHEVFKTGQYHVHGLGDIVGRCFVMALARFARGRPRGLPPTTPVYVCGARYDEVTCRFRAIKSWAACMPDELRAATAAGTDYPLDLFAPPLPRLAKIPSPIKHLLREDARETDPLPKPTMGSANAPPMVGAVHRRPRLPNESPPPPDLQPTPGLPTEMQLDPSRPPPGAPAYLHSGMPPRGVIASPSPHVPYAQQQFVPRPRAMPLPSMPGHQQQQPQQQQQPAPLAAQVPPQQLPMHPGSHHLAPAPAGSPMYAPGFGTPQPHHPQQPSPMPGAMMIPQGPPPPQGGFDPRFAPPQQAQLHNRMVPSPGPGPGPGPGGRGSATPAMSTLMPTPQFPPGAGGAGLPPPVPNGYIPPRPAAEAFILPADVDQTIPADVRQRFHCDAEGRVVFFTAPSARRQADVEGQAEGTTGLAADYAGLGHSVRYLNGLESFREERRRKRKERDEARAAETAERAAQQAEEHDAATRQLYGAAGEALGGFVQWMDVGTQAVEASLGWEGTKKRAVEKV